MRSAVRGLVAALGLVLALCAAPACSTSDPKQVASDDNGGSATETNVAPLHCFTNADCAPGHTCVHAAGQQDGACSTGSADGPAAPGGSHEPASDEDAGGAR